MNSKEKIMSDSALQSPCPGHRLVAEGRCNPTKINLAFQHGSCWKTKARPGFCLSEERREEF